MRISTMQFYAQARNAILDNQSKLLETHDQLATGKRADAAQPHAQDLSLTYRPIALGNEFGLGELTGDADDLETLCPGRHEQLVSLGPRFRHRRVGDAIRRRDDAGGLDRLGHVSGVHRADRAVRLMPLRQHRHERLKVSNRGSQVGDLSGDLVNRDVDVLLVLSPWLSPHTRLPSVDSLTARQCLSRHSLDCSDIFRSVQRSAQRTCQRPKRPRRSARC